MIDNRIKNDSSKSAVRKIYSTEIIDKLLEERAEGYDIPFDAFFQRNIDLRASNITFRMTDEELREYQRCFDEPEYFIETYCKFMTDDGMHTVSLRDYQRKIISAVTDEEYSEELDDFIPANRSIVICASRQIGKTTTIAAFVAWFIVFHADKNVLIVANKEDTAKEIVDKITKIFKGLPFFLKPGCDNFGKTGLRLDNGSRIISSATTTSASIGFTIHCMLLDEFAHIPDNIVNNFWRSVYPTLSSSKVSQCIICSTPNGTTNKFYDIWSGALAGLNSFKPIRVDYWEVPGHDDAWAEEMKRNFGEEEFAQEFELQFNINSKMLLKAEDLKFIDRIKRDFINKEIISDSPYLNDEHITWDPLFDPNEIDEHDKFVFLIDIAEGVGQEDERFKNKKKTPDSNTINIFRLRLNSLSNMRKYSKLSCSIKDAFRFEQVGKYTTNTEDEVQQGKIAAALAYDLFRDHDRDNVRIMVEMNFNGKAFTESFKRHPYFTDSTILRTYHTKPVPGEKQRKRLGFKTTANKEFYCLRGNKLINMRRTIIHDTETFTQMCSYGYVRGRLNGIACHDDLSMPVFNHIPRMLDESSFIDWLNEYLELWPNETEKYNINSLIEMWDMENPELSDSDFKSLYSSEQSNIAPFNFDNPYIEPKLDSIYSDSAFSSTYSSLLK